MKFLKYWSWFTLLSMLIVTSWASTHESVVVALQRLPSDPWFIATMFDAYFGFIFFWFWVLYRERQSSLTTSHWIIRSIAWLIGILLLGNIAMAVYILLQISKFSPSDSLEKLFKQ